MSDFNLTPAFLMMDDPIRLTWLHTFFLFWNCVLPLGTLVVVVCGVALKSAVIVSACCLTEMAERRQSDGRPAPSLSCLRSLWRRSITSAFLRHSHVIEETVMSDLCWQLCYEVCGCKVSGRAAKEFPHFIDLGGRGAEWRIYTSVTATKRTTQPRLAQCSLNHSILYFIFV